jgi:hypothetical protein
VFPVCEEAELVGVYLPPQGHGLADEPETAPTRRGNPVLVAPFHAFAPLSGECQWPRDGETSTDGIDALRVGMREYVLEKGAVMKGRHGLADEPETAPTRRGNPVLVAPFHAFAPGPTRSVSQRFFSLSGECQWPRDGETSTDGIDALRVGMREYVLGP